MPRLYSARKKLIHTMSLDIDRPITRAVVVGCAISATRNYLKLHMSRTLKVLSCATLVPKRGSCGSVLPGCRLSKQYPSINSSAAGCCTSRARRDAHCTLLGSPVCRDTRRLVLASRLPSRAAPTCEPHSARCSAGCHTSRDFVPWRFLDAGQLSLWSVLSLPASKNQHIFRLMQRSKVSPVRSPRWRVGSSGSSRL